MNNKIDTTEKSYFQWLEDDTATRWWHDSADPAEIELALEHKASGATTNPILVAGALASNPDFWKTEIGDIPEDLSAEAKTELKHKAVVQYAAAKFIDQYESSNGECGYACAQVSPAKAGYSEEMIKDAKKYAGWAPNISVKFPATAAGLDALEECIALGISVTSTVNYTVPQVIEVAERFNKAKARAEKAGIKPGKCFAVIMIGRIDDYLREVANDNHANVTEADINKIGIAITKRAYKIYQERGYEPKLLVAALRGTHHMLELCGADLIMSIHPKFQGPLLEAGTPRKLRIDEEVAPDTIERLSLMPEFVRAYEPDGMKPEEFITYGVVQKTLAQFQFTGWNKI
ncbi:MAG: hypothetical protein DRQ57_15535 [Gammaproteobacteria bacterium]|nr:MAG: hypothetical protein DRQ57_15535 [Gammaproteobacteria bacterium]